MDLYTLFQMNGRHLFLAQPDNENDWRLNKPWADTYVPMAGYQRKVESFSRLDSLVEQLENERRR